ncbi:hypothetical protein ACUH9H_02025 [Dermabacteraceae bacterium P13128]
MTTPVSRRTIAKGAAWAVPATIVASAAPAMASSVPGVGQPVVCNLFFGTATVNGQDVDMSVGLKPTDTLLKKGQKYTWTVTATDGGMDVPDTNYSANDRWRFTTDKPAGSPAKSFTATLEIIADNVTDTEISCAPKLLWDVGNSAGSSSIVPGTKLSIKAVDSEGKNPSGLGVQIPGRRATSRISNTATKFLGRSGGQNEFPSVRYSAFSSNVAANSSHGSTCRASGGNNTSTIYPDGSCAFLQIRNGQASLPARP